MNVHVVTADMLNEYGPLTIASFTGDPQPARHAEAGQKTAWAILADEAKRIGLMPEDIVAPDRQRVVVEARDMAVYRMRTELRMTLAAIGAILNRDHTSALHSYQKVAARGGKRLGLTFSPPRQPKPPHVSEKRFDHDAAMAMLAGGRTLQEVASQYGVSRERIRQIAANRQVRSVNCRANVEDRSKSIEELIATGHRNEEIAEKLGTTEVAVAKERRRLGFRPEKAELREVFMAPYVEMVREGRSITSIAELYGFNKGLLATACRNAGVVVTNHGRHRDFGGRKDLIVRLRQSGETWGDIARAVSIDERKHLGMGAIYAWARNHVPEAFGAR